MDKTNIEKAMRIYYFLLKQGELTFDSNRELYLDYSDSEVREILEVMADESSVTIEKYNQVIYLIPDEENDVIGIKDMDLQKVISYDARKVDFYLSQYIIITIITVFFGGRGSFVKSRDFIRISELEEVVTADGSPRRSFISMLKKIAETVNTDRPLYEFLFFAPQAFSHEENEKAEWKEYQKRLYSVLMELITQGIQQGQFPAMEPRLVLKALGGLFHGLVFWGMDRGSITEDQIGDMLDNLLRKN